MIGVRGLTIRMEGLVIVSDTTFSVERGELALLAGDSGSGKSTLLSVLGGLASERPELEVDGEILLEGVDVLSSKPKDVARVAGQVFQAAEDQLLSLDVEGEVALKLENMGIPLRTGMPLVVETLARYGLIGHERRETARLSGGEARRVALAQATSNNPPVLLMDEPLTGLSPRWRDRLLLDLADWKGRGTSLVAEHRAAPLMGLADRAFYLGDGRLIGIEPSLLAAQSEPSPEPPAPRPVPGTDPVRLSFESVTVNRSGRGVLTGLDLESRRGFVCLTGENGAGKSTLLKAACGLLPVEEGQVRIAGLNPHGTDAKTLARRVGYVPQHASDAFTCNTVQDELALAPKLLGLPEGEDVVNPEMLRWNLLLLSASHPLSLSGGERQRLAFACAFAQRPEVILLDEPTVGLDAPTLRTLLEAIHERSDGGLVLAATHDDRLLAHADGTLELADGRIHAPETKAEVAYE